MLYREYDSLRRYLRISQGGQVWLQSGSVCPKMGQIQDFSEQISTKKYWNMTWKSPGFVPVGDQSDRLLSQNCHPWDSSSSLACCAVYVRCLSLIVCFLFSQIDSFFCGYEIVWLLVDYLARLQWILYQLGEYGGELQRYVARSRLGVDRRTGVSLDCEDQRYVGEMIL